MGVYNIGNYFFTIVFFSTTKIRLEKWANKKGVIGFGPKHRLYNDNFGFQIRIPTIS